MVGKLKSAKKLERHFKGVANHWRIQILLLVKKSPEVTLDNITESLNANTKTISAHVQRLVQAGLVEKAYAGRSVQHQLTPYGKEFVAFIERFARHGSRT